MPLTSWRLEGAIRNLLEQERDLGLLVTLALLESAPMGLLFSIYAPYLKGFFQLHVLDSPLLPSSGGYRCLRASRPH